MLGEVLASLHLSDAQQQSPRAGSAEGRRPAARFLTSHTLPRRLLPVRGTIPGSPCSGPLTLPLELTRFADSS